MTAFDRVVRLLGRCNDGVPIQPPTALYNEGWMLRLILDWYAEHPSQRHTIGFEANSVWYSEALLGSRFFGDKRGDARAEGWTHADGVVGHFRLRPGGRGDIEVVPGASQLTLTEAKMGSLLSAGTKNAPTFNQAARNVACMAHLLCRAELRPEAFKRLEFLVIAPGRRVDEGAFATQLDKAGMERIVKERADVFGGAHSDWLEQWFSPTLAKCKIAAVTWEHLLGEVGETDEAAGRELLDFYSKCLRFNPFSAIRSRVG